MISVVVVGNCNYNSQVDLMPSARALGASSITFTAQRENKQIIDLNKRVMRKWGGEFKVRFSRTIAESFKDKRNYKIVYLTQFGEPLNKIAHTLKAYRNLLIVVSSKESIKSIMDKSDFKVSVSRQPNSTTAALSIFLHVFFEGRELAVHFKNHEQA